MIEAQEAALEGILEARSPVEVFGDVSDAGELQSAFHRLSKLVHPDLNKDPKASQAMQALSEFYRVANEQLLVGRYGDVPTIKVTTRKGVYELSPEPFAKGHCATFYAGMSDDAVPVLLKLARYPKDRDLLQREAQHIRTLVTHWPDEAIWFPELVESGVRVRIGGGKELPATIFRRSHPELYSLAYVRGQYPRGVLAKDVAWIFRRVLKALGMTHDAGLVHGAPFLEHMLIEPNVRGFVMIDWKHGVEIGQTMSVVPPGFKILYPPEVIRKEPVGPATDICIAATQMRKLLQGRHQHLDTFFRGCTYTRASLRPQNAWELRDEFDDLLRRLWGKRVFEPFQLNRRG